MKIESDSNIEDLVGKSIIKDNKKVLTITSAMDKRAIGLSRIGSIDLNQVIDFHGYKLSMSETSWNKKSR